MINQLKLVPLEPKHFDETIKLGNKIQGKAYLTNKILGEIYQKSLKDEVNCSFVMIDTAGEDAEKIIGFRLTYAPTNWQLDEWCSPELWKLPIEQLCYFKSSNVDPDYRGQGIAKQMLRASADAVKKQGGKGGVCHTWMQSPGNAAYQYIIKCGAHHIKTHIDRWVEDSQAGYRCIVCGLDQYCHCDAGEMILYFDEIK